MSTGGSGRRAAVLLLATALGGCGLLPGFREAPRLAVTLQGEPVRHFELDGRVSVKAEDRNFSGGLTWLRGRTEESLRLSTPLGQGAAEIHRQDGALTLKGADGSTIVAENDESLMESVLGVRLPLEGLVFWLSALPRPGVAYSAQLDEHGHVAGLEQDGWRIEYSRFRQYSGRWLPGRLFARRGDDIEFRLVVDNWEVR